MRAELWRHRFAVAAALLGLATALVVDRLTPTPERTLPVVVSAADLPAGAELTPAHLRTVRLPAVAVTDGTPGDPDAVVGRTLAVTVPAGTVIVGPLLVDDTATGPPGTVVAGVRLAEPALAAVLSPGMHVDLLAPVPTVDLGPDVSAAAAATLAVRALVLPHPGATPRSSGLLPGSPGDGGGPSDLVLVAVTPDEAARLANVSGRGSVSAVVVR